MTKRKLLVLGAVLCCTALVLAVTTPPGHQPKSQQEAASAAPAPFENVGSVPAAQVAKTARITETVRPKPAEATASFDLRAQDVTATAVPPAKHVEVEVPQATGGTRALGDDCTQPIVVAVPADLPYVDANQTTCGRGNTYSATCLGNYDGGEDIIYQLDVAAPITLDITATGNDSANNWIGVGIDSACPQAATCLAFAVSSSGTVAKINAVSLAAGTYYVIVDTYPSPTCLTDFTLTVEEVADPCPPGSEPANDECVAATPITGPYPVTVSGDNTCAAVDCPGVLDWRATWWTIDLPYAANDLVIDYCGSPQEIYSVGVIVYATCPTDPNACGAYIVRDSITWPTCSDTLVNPSITWKNLPGPGTIYFPASCELEDETPLPYTFTADVQPYVPSYCDASGGCDEYIANVLCGTIDNTTVCENYADYTSLYTKVYTTGSVAMTVTLGTSYTSDHGGLWVDWNEDLDFDDADEAITTAWLGVGPYTTTIVPPAGVVPGDKRMRIRLTYNAAPLACGTTTYGEVEDYTLTVTEPPPFGACCLGATCVLTDEDDCTITQGGTYKGDGTTCDPNPCVGACCHADGTCTLELAADCVAPSVYQGDGTACDPSPCPQPGACCFADGHCELSTVIDPGFCAAGGVYLGDDTVCDPNPCPQPCVCDVTVNTFPYCETWEDPNMPFGLWTQSADDMMEWTRDSGGTSSSDTGPAVDHTLGTSAGYYLYTEASSYNPDFVAILNGPCVDLSTLSAPTLTFWYHMYGSTMGSLSFEVSTDYCITWTALWTLAGNQGNEWHFASVDLSAYAGQTIQVRFRGVTGSSYYSDMAIDDVCFDEYQVFSGACCNADVCTPDVTEADCVAGGGTYQGDFSDCDPNPCIGACCYADGSCTLLTEADCLASTGGSYPFGGGSTCSPNMCPQPPPDNDLCEYATDILAVPFADLNVNYGAATPDIDISCNSSSCSGTNYGVWYTYTPAANCDATLTRVGTTASQDTAAAIFTGPDCNNLTEVACADAETLTYAMTAGVKYWILIGRWSCSSVPTGNLDISFNCSAGACCVAGACTIESPTSCAALGGVYSGDGVPCDPDPCLSGACCFFDGSCQVSTGDECPTLGGTYLGDGTTCSPTNPCPQPGDTCENPLHIELPLQLDYTDANQSTCGRGNDYADTCMGYYDGGEDIIYEVVVTDAICVDIVATGNSSANTYVGVGVDTVCPLGDPCIAAAGSGSGTVATISGLVLIPGTYYIMVDSWPSPNCLNDFTLTITASTACASGACCDAVLGCYVAYEEVCVAGGGTFMGNGTTCDPTDCQPNGMPDMCDIALGLSQDCQGNGVPDECDIAAGTSQDVDQNGIPDDCDVDCNGNGIPDACELPGGCATGNCSSVAECGTGSDCQPNGILDECELGGKGPRYEYLYDDGTHEDGLGISAGADLVALSKYTVVAGAESIDSISVVWGAVSAGVPATVYVWADPTQDGNPADAYVIGQGSTVTANVDLDIFNVVALDAPVNVGSAGTIFYVGLMITSTEFPIAIDETTPTAGTHWIAGDTGYAIDPNDLGNPAYNNPLALIESFGFAGNLMIRANGVAAGADCNGNGVPDDCDIADGTSLDCNGNGKPDECELADHDCNANGIPDDCDIAAGTSLDCNANGIPDECDIAVLDCNGNGIPDDCDIANCDGSTWCSDCNNNGIPDGCDIANCPTGELWCNDCQGDGIPDGCQLNKGRDVLLTEGFEGGVIPPTDWTAVVNNPYTWEIDSTSPYDGSYDVVCFYDGTYSGTQDEWIISPELNASGTLTVSGYTQGSVYWGQTPYDNYDVEAWAVIGPNVNDGDDIYIGQIDALWTANWVWVPFSFDFPAPGGAFRLGFRYHGYDGAQGNLDLISLEGQGGAPANDCNMNGIPDECDIDMAFGGYCDPALGTCDTDYNYNEIPDDCEFCGDFDGNAVVDAADFQLFLASYATCVGDAAYNPDADYNGDGCIGLVDYQSWLMCYKMANGKAFRQKVLLPASPGTTQSVQRIPTQSSFAE